MPGGVVSEAVQATWQAYPLICGTEPVSVGLQYMRMSEKNIMKYQLNLAGLMQQSIDDTSAGETSALTDESRDLAERIAGMKVFGALGLFPLTNGNFAYFPSGIVGKSYELPASKAAELLGKVDGKGFSEKEIIVFVVLGAVAFSVLAPDAMKLFFTIAAAAVAVVAVPLGLWVTRRKTDRELGGYPPARVRFRNDYYRARQMMSVMHAPGLGTFMGIFTGLFGLLAFVAGVGSLIFVGSEVLFMPAASILFGLLLVFNARSHLKYANANRRFRRRHGRRVGSQDLQPIDPETGKMTPDPFSTD